MNLLKRWRKDEGGGGSAGGTTALIRRGEHGFDDMFSRMRGELDRTFDRLWKDPWSALDEGFGGLPSTLNMFNAWPAVDVSEDDNAVTLRVGVPGLAKKDLDVEASGNLL